MRIIAALITFFVVAGCTASGVWPPNRPDCVMGIRDGLGPCAPGTLGYRQGDEGELQAQATAIAANDDAQCQSYGAAPGSQSYIQCRMNLDNQRAQMRTAVASQLVGRMMTPPPQPQTLNVNVCNVPGQVNTCMYPHQ